MKRTALKVIDLKAEWAQNSGQREVPARDLSIWLRESKPLAFLFLAVRVADDKDLEKTLFLANAADQIMDAVGLVAYKINPAGDGYQACNVPPHLELDHVLSRVYTALPRLP